MCDIIFKKEKLGDRLSDQKRSLLGPCYMFSMARPMPALSMQDLKVPANGSKHISILILRDQIEHSIQYLYY